MQAPCRQSVRTSSNNRLTYSHLNCRSQFNNRPFESHSCGLLSSAHFPQERSGWSSSCLVLVFWLALRAYQNRAQCLKILKEYDISSSKYYTAGSVRKNTQRIYITSTSNCHLNFMSVQWLKYICIFFFGFEFMYVLPRSPTTSRVDFLHAGGRYCYLVIFLKKQKN